MLRHANDDEVDFEPTIEDIEHKINKNFYEKHEQKMKKFKESSTKNLAVD